MGRGSIVSLTKLGTVWNEGEAGTPSPYITEGTESDHVVGRMRIYPPIEGDCIIVEVEDHVGGGIVTSRVRQVIDMAGDEYIIVTSNSVYELSLIAREGGEADERN